MTLQKTCLLCLEPWWRISAAAYAMAACRLGAFSSLRAAAAKPKRLRTDIQSSRQSLQLLGLPTLSRVVKTGQDKAEYTKAHNWVGPNQEKNI